jgi:hypothetical protein
MARPTIAQLEAILENEEQGEEEKIHRHTKIRPGQSRLPERHLSDFPLTKRSRLLL